jgi:catechol 2,3-dioxygenase-like lactoylglutathione lyase family enzyme
MPKRNTDHPDQDREPRLLVAHPQLFVSDIRRAADFYVGTLGFSVVYFYGEPPFYGQVARDGAVLNLRHVDSPPIDQALRERESLLSAYIVVDGIKELFLRFRHAGAAFAQTLTSQPGGATDFIVRDLDGNLIGFASPAPAPAQAE